MVGQQHLFIFCFTREHFSVLKNYSIGSILLVHLNICERKTEVTISMGIQGSTKEKKTNDTGRNPRYWIKPHIKFIF